MTNRRGGPSFGIPSETDAGECGNGTVHVLIPLMIAFIVCRLLSRGCGGSLVLIATVAGAVGGGRTITAVVAVAVTIATSAAGLEDGVSILSRHTVPLGRRNPTQRDPVTV